MAPYFFRVEHDLLRSESFKTLGGSAIKVYLVIGLYSDFGTDWAYPSIRTIARQAGLSRQTVLVAIAELTRRGLLATSKSKGRSTAYKIIRQGPERPEGGSRAGRAGAAKGRGVRSEDLTPAGLLFLEGGGGTDPDSLEPTPPTVPEFLEPVARESGRRGREGRPEREPGPREDTTSIPI